MLKRIFLCFAVLIFMAGAAQARVDILPRKIVMESRDRSAEITILNLFDEPSFYRISLLNYQQNPDGSYTTLDGPLNPAFDPSTAVRLSPRQFTVSAGGRQKIRISLRKPADLPEGEYRFHVLATRFKADDSDQEETVPVKGTQIQLEMNVGVAIPVVVRHGQLSVDAEIADVRLMQAHQTERKRPEAVVTINRSGTASAVGKLELVWTPQGGSDRRIGFIDNMNVFSEVDARTIAVPLQEYPTGAGSLKIIYRNEEGEVFDEKTISP